MVRCKSIVTIVLLLLAFHIQAQNELNQRAFWSANPGVAQIQAKIDEGHSATTLNSNAFDAVTWALIEKTNNEAVKYLLSIRGNDVNKLTHDGRTYIFWAAYKANIEMMQYLLDRGAKTDIIDDHGNSIANFAASTGQLDTRVYDLLIANGTNIAEEVNQDGANALLLIAPHLSDAKLIDYFVEQGLDIHSKDNNGNGIFNYAARKGNIDLLNKLITLGVDYRRPNTLRGNAMLFASRGMRRHVNDLQVFKYLEALKIPANVTNTNGTNPLHYLASSCKDVAVINHFLQKRVNSNQVNDQGNTPFLNAARSNTLEVLSTLYNAKTMVNHTNENGQSALALAVQRNSPEVVEFLLNKGADVSSVDKKGFNLAFYLFSSFDVKNRKPFDRKLAILEKGGFDITTPQKNGATLLHLAVDQNDINHVLYALKHRIDVNIKNNDGMTALHIAAMKATSTEILKVLLQNGADPGIKTDFEETAYQLAEENEILAQNNVDISFLRQ